MSEEIKMIIDDSKEKMELAISHLESELLKVRAGKANPVMLDGLFVDYYGTSTPLSQVANINSPDARTLVVQPWEKSRLGPIEKSVMASNRGFNPQNDGIVIRINIPPLTEERRRDLVKKAKAEAENCKVTVRNLRRDANEMIKGEIKGGMPEDLGKDAETKIQQLTDSYILKADRHLDLKEREIMTI